MPRPRRNASIARKQPTPYPKVVARVSQDEGYSNISTFMSGMASVAAKFPFEFYEVINQLVLVDPYISKFHHTTIALGNQGHRIQLDAPSEARANEAIQVANNFAARCFPLSGGMDGLVSALFSQEARYGGLCAEWVPDLALSQVDRAYVIPMKTLRWQWDKKQKLVLYQQQALSGKPGQLPGLVPLNPVQTVYHAATLFDGNPYPVPPCLAALESCAVHRTIMKKIQVWMEKVSALGVLTAQVERPPRVPGQSPEAYNAMCQAYLQEMAQSITQNMSSGIGVAFDNVTFTFNNTQASAQGAKDILQVVLQGLFAGLQRDPIFFGWAFNKTESFARVVYEEMMQGVHSFQLGIKRALEHGHRLNFALSGMGDIGVSVAFNVSSSIDAFRDAEAKYMDAQSAISQVEAGIIDISQAQEMLGHTEKKAGVGAFIATFNKEANHYALEPFQRTSYPVALELQQTTPGGADVGQYGRELQKELTRSFDDGFEVFWSWLLSHSLGPSASGVDQVLSRLIDSIESAVDVEAATGSAGQRLRSSWEAGRDKTIAASGVTRDRAASLSDDDLAAIAYLAAIVEPYMIGSVLSRSQFRQDQIRTLLLKWADKKGWGPGADTKDLQRFKLELKYTLSGMAMKAAGEIADGGITRAHTWAGIYALRDAGITEYIINGPRDDRKCAYCWAMLGRVFSVEVEFGNIQSLVDSGNPDIVNEWKPLKNRFPGVSGLEELKNMTDTQVQETGIAAPPYHNFCRDWVEAKRSE